MGTDVIFADSTSSLGALAWLGMLGALVLLTLRFSKVLAVMFFVAGVGAPIFVLSNFTEVVAGNCEEQIVHSGNSPDMLYKWQIIGRRCQNEAHTRYEVKMGREGYFEPMHTVFTGDDYSKPTGLTPRGRHEFALLLESSQRMGGERTPLRVRMDPSTGVPEDRYVHRLGSSQ